ncbi:MAG: peptide-methionine (S)-S-oxide reductase, partial [Saprospiraceae bacterium]|nr:peptide-methionine (S)-S-oxide reductase [Saprospiraceae bacterium]
MKIPQYFSLLFLLFLTVSCHAQQQGASSDIKTVDEYVSEKDYDQYERAIFAGGCFWCTEASFERIQGVVDVISGYSGGEKAHPTYAEVSRGQTDHAESI